MGGAVAEWAAETSAVLVRLVSLIVVAGVFASRAALTRNIAYRIRDGNGPSTCQAKRGLRRVRVAPSVDCYCKVLLTAAFGSTAAAGSATSAAAATGSAAGAGVSAASTAATATATGGRLLGGRPAATTLPAAAAAG